MATRYFGGNGAQIIPPHDAEIAQRIDAIASIDEIPLGSTDGASLAHIEASYLENLHNLPPHRESPRDFDIAYTALHGVGQDVALKALSQAGFERVHGVPEQAKPDGAFPTVSFPNPEEDGAMDMVLDLGAKVGAELILANDPDADRLAVSVLHGGRYIPLSGNEIGCLLAHYLLEQGPTVDNPLVVSTIVSSPMLGAIAEFHNARWEQTLTGHKWIHNRAIELESDAFNYVFGYEEALGYAPSASVRDKDGVSSAVLLADAAAHCRSQGRTLIDELERMWSMYGLFMSSQVSRVFDDTSMIASAVETFRNDPPKKIAGIDVLAITDVKHGQRTLRDGTTSRIGLPSSNLLVYELVGGHRAMLRPSGTEPKLKHYFDVRVSLDDPSRVNEAKDSAKSLLERLANDLAG